MNWRELLSTICVMAMVVVFFVCLVMIQNAYSRTIGNEPSMEHQYEGEDLKRQQAKGPSKCALLSHMAGDIQSIRQKTHDDYKTFYDAIEQSYPDIKPVYKDGKVVKKGRYRVIMRRQLQHMGKIVYSQFSESMPPNVVMASVHGQCKGGRNY